MPEAMPMTTALMRYMRALGWKAAMFSAYMLNPRSMLRLVVSKFKESSSLKLRIIQTPRSVKAISACKHTGMIIVWSFRMYATFL